MYGAAEDEEEEDFSALRQMLLDTQKEIDGMIEGPAKGTESQ